MQRWKQYVRRLQGSTVRFDLRAYTPSLAAIAALERELTGAPEEEIRGHAVALRARAAAGERRGGCP